MKDAAVNRLAKSITQLTLCQVTTSEVDAATKLLDKACQKLQGIHFFLAGARCLSAGHHFRSFKVSKTSHLRGSLTLKLPYAKFAN